MAIQTVIGPELEATLQALRIPEKAKRYDRGSTFWEGKVESVASGRKLDVVVHCQGEPGSQAASAAATKLLERFRPAFMILSGIAAGRRGKVKIGDVAIPRAVADLTQKVAEVGRVSGRPIIDRLPYSVTQLLRPFSPERAGFHKRFCELLGSPIVSPKGQESEYASLVAVEPDIHEAAIASDDLLLRDPKVLEGLSRDLHQQIRIGEMEASGFVAACESVSPPVPWLVVRGVSDFGDEFKDDRFHRLASVAAATYVAVFLRHGCDIRMFCERSRQSAHVAPAMLLVLGAIAAIGAAVRSELQKTLEFISETPTNEHPEVENRPSVQNKPAEADMGAPPSSPQVPPPPSLGGPAVQERSDEVDPRDAKSTSGATSDETSSVKEKSHQEERDTAETKGNVPIPKPKPGRAPRGGGLSSCPDVTLKFGFDSPNVEPKDQSQLVELAECLRNNGASILIEAHAEPREGKAEYCIMLTDKRGVTVKEYLQSLGVDPSRMTIVSKGSLDAMEAPLSRRKEYRRVNIFYQ